MAVTVLISALVLVAAPELVRFFNGKAEVVALGTLFLHKLTPFYVFCCVNQIYSGALRGSGNSRTPMLIMLFSFVLFRHGYLYVVSHFIANEILPLAMGYPAGWLMCSLLTLFYYHHTQLDRTRLVTDDEVQK